MTLNNLVNRIWLRFIKLLYRLTLHFLWEDWLGGLWNGDGSLHFTTITKRQ